MVGPAPHRFAALDSWRGLAALAVAFHHINGTAFFLGTQFQGNLSFAVDFFFVLSGFVIAASYGDRLAGGFPLMRYAVLRWGRVWPLHALVVALLVLLEAGLAIFGTGGVLQGREAFTGTRDPATLPVTLLLLQSWVWPERGLWDVQAWSLSIEMGLYLLAALMWRWLGRSANWLALAMAVAALFLLQVPPDWSVSILRGIAGFGLGMGMWSLHRRLEGWSLTSPMASAAELVLLGLLVVLLSGTWPLAALDPLFAAMVLLFARQQGIVSRVLLTAPMRWLGVLSYALYMVHGLVIGRVYDLLAVAQARAGAQWVTAHLGGGDMLLLAPLPALAVCIVMLGLSLVAAWLAWRFVEWPARAWSRRLAERL